MNIYYFLTETICLQKNVQILHSSILNYAYPFSISRPKIHMNPLPYWELEYSHHFLLVSLPSKSEADTILLYLYHHRLVFPVFELHDKILLLYVRIYVLFHVWFPLLRITWHPSILFYHSWPFLELWKGISVYDMPPFSFSSSY